MLYTCILLTQNTLFTTVHFPLGIGHEYGPHEVYCNWPKMQVLVGAGEMGSVLMAFSKWKIIIYHNRHNLHTV